MITIEKYEKDVHYWLNNLNQLLEGEKEMKEIHPSIQYEIKPYLSDLKDFSESLMKALIINLIMIEQKKIVILKVITHLCLLILFVC